MGSIVKTIGKVIKKVGKALKKIAPVLLIAAAAYVGYGYMTGFQSGGWPQITEWGKSLMGNVSSGMPISEAATYADPSALADAAPYSAETFPYSGAGSVAGTPLDVTTTPPLETGLLGTQPSSVPVDIDAAANLAIDSMPEMAAGASAFVPEMASDPAGMISAMGDTGATVAEAGGLISGPRINPLFDSMDAEYKSTGLVDSFSDFLVGRANAAEIEGTGVYDPTFSIEEFDYPVTTTTEDVWSNQPVTQRPGPAGPRSPYAAAAIEDVIPVTPAAENTLSDQLPNSYPIDIDTFTSSGFGEAQRTPRTIPDWLSRSNKGNLNLGGFSGGELDTASNTIMSWGGKAWGIFKAALEKNPGMVMWSAAKIIETIATLVDDSEEQESYAARHVMGFTPGNYDDLRNKYGGMPTSKKSDFWKSADAGNQGRLTASSKVKTGTKPMGNTRISAINGSPGGIIGPTKQVQA